EVLLVLHQQLDALAEQAGPHVGARQGEVTADDPRRRDGGGDRRGGGGLRLRRLGGGRLGRALRRHGGRGRGRGRGLLGQLGRRREAGRHPGQRGGLERRVSVGEDRAGQQRQGPGHRDQPATKLRRDAPL